MSYADRARAKRKTAAKPRPARSWQGSISTVRGKVLSFLRLYGVPILLTLAAVAGTVYYCWPSGPEATAGVDAFGRRVKLSRSNLRKAMSPRDAVREAMRTAKLPKRKRGSRAIYKIAFSNFSGVERRQAQKIQAALDSDDLAATVSAAEDALRSKNPELRYEAVQALGWFGPEALPELTAAMSDADPEVSRAAENAWELGVSELENPADRIEVAAATMASITDHDSLISIAGQFACAVTEYVDMEENEKVAAERRLAVVQLLVNIIEGDVPPACVEGAKEAYSDVTGEDWAGVEEAERYLNEEYDYAADAESEADDGETVDGETVDGESVDDGDGEF